MSHTSAALDTKDQRFDHFENGLVEDFLQWEDSVSDRRGSMQFPQGSSHMELRFDPGSELAHPNGGPEWISKHAYQFGTFSCSMKAARCALEEECVSSFFTYFHDDDPEANASEIDIEILGSEPENVYLTIWTHAEFNNHRQKRVTRVIDMRQGCFKQTVLDDEGCLHRDHPFSPPAFPVTGSFDFAFPDFDASAKFYEYTFEWQEDCIRYFISIDGEKHLLWEFTEQSAIPQKAATLRANLWWTDVHWNKDEKAISPQTEMIHRFDCVSYKR